jgi:hypothetical protein
MAKKFEHPRDGDFHERELSYNCNYLQTVVKQSTKFIFKITMTNFCITYVIYIEIIVFLTSLSKSSEYTFI